MGQDLLRLAQVGLDDRGVRVPGQQGPAVRDRDRVDVDVGDPRTGDRPLGDLVHIRLGRHPRADVWNWRTPLAARNRTARPRNARLAWAISRIRGSTATMARPASWSARKLWLPPSQ